MGEVADTVAVANTFREAAGADGRGADPVWRGTTEG